MKDALLAGLRGVLAPVGGFQTLIRHRSLWPAAAVPVGLGLTWSAFDLLGLAAAPVGGQWWWVAIAYVLRYALLAGVVLLQVWIAVASPLLDWLSEQTEEALGTLPIGPVWWRELASWKFWRRAAAALVEGVKLLALKLGLAVVGLALGWLPVVGPPIAWLCAGIATGIDFLDYPLARRGVTLRQKIAWGRRNWAAALGFCGVVFVAALVPGLMGLMLVPAVVGGTELVIGTNDLPH